MSDILRNRPLQGFETTWEPIALRGGSPTVWRRMPLASTAAAIMATLIAAAALLCQNAGRKAEAAQSPHYRAADRQILPAPSSAKKTIKAGPVAHAKM